MPLILAIEPDRRQRHALDAIVRQRVSAELILADTTERALDAIGDRVPDLVLVPALLAPQDDAALAAALRVIAAAAHVRTLTIPVLAGEVTHVPQSGGLLARWRRGRDASPAAQGCDPAVFADQVTAYLAEAAAARAELIDDAAGESPAPPREDEPAFEAYAFEPMIAASAEPTLLQDEPNAAPEPAFALEEAVVAAAEPMLVLEEAVLAADEPIVVGHERPVPFHESMFVGADIDGDADEEDIDLSGELEGLDDDESDELDSSSDEIELFDGEPIGVYTMPALADTASGDEPDLVALATGAREIETYAFEPTAAEPMAVEPFVEAHALYMDALTAPAFAARAFDANPLDDDADDTNTPDAHPLDAHVVEVREPEAPPVDAPVLVAAADEMDMLAEFGDDAEPDPADVEPWMAAELGRPYAWPALEGVPAEIFVATPRPAVDAPRPAASPATRERTEWTELVASLRQDLERRRAEPAPVAAPPAKAKRPPKTAKPVQDEWGFFDPEQCGFAALLAKLDEITEVHEDVDVRPH